MSKSDTDAEAARAAQVASGHVVGMRARADCPQGTPAQKQAAMDYMRARLDGDIATIMRLVDPNICFVSQRDGEHRGARAFGAYLQQTPVEGSWGQPMLDPQTGLVRIDGRIRYMKLVPITVKGVFRFNKDGKIVELFVGKA